VRFVEGFFNESLPRDLPKDTKLAIVRADGDLYESTMDTLYHTYDLLQVGGFFICDDCGGIPVAARAVFDFRLWHNIADPITNVDGFTWFWQKGAGVKLQWEHWAQLDTERRADKQKHRVNFYRSFLWDAKQSESCTAEGMELPRLFRTYWENPELRPELAGAAHLLAFRLEECGDRLPAGVEVLQLLRELLHIEGPSLALTFAEDALARILFAAKDPRAAVDVAQAAAKTLASLRGEDWQAERTRRLDAFKRLGSVAEVADLQAIEASANFGSGCRNDWLERSSWLRRQELSGHPFGTADMVAPEAAHEGLRYACSIAGFRLASVQFALPRYLQRIQAGATESSVIETVQLMSGAFPEGAAATTLAAGGLSLCLPRSCAGDSAGLPAAVLEHFAVVASGVLPPVGLAGPRLGDELNVTFDPGGASSSWGDGSMR